MTAASSPAPGTSDDGSTSDEERLIGTYRLVDFRDIADDGEVRHPLGPDAVGLTMWVPPGGAPASGYTIAMVSRRQGAVVAVTGSTADRALAVQVALAVAATT